MANGKDPGSFGRYMMNPQREKGERFSETWKSPGERTLVGAGLTASTAGLAYAGKKGYDTLVRGKPDTFKKRVYLPLLVGSTAAGIGAHALRHRRLKREMKKSAAFDAGARAALERASDGR